MADTFRRFSVVRKHREAEGITSFQLVPADGAALWPARPGQYLTLRLPVPGGPVLRTYSISSDVADGTHYRISVKREAAPGVPAGVGSCWLHDQVVEGDVVEVAAPRGSFVLDEAGARPVLLLAGGIGVTPLLSMLHRLAQSRRRVVFVQACENGAVHALRDEVAALAAASGGRIVARSVYRQPSPQDRGRCDAEGLVDRAFLQSLLPLDHYEVYEDDGRDPSRSVEAAAAALRAAADLAGQIGALLDAAQGAIANQGHRSLSERVGGS